MLPLPQLKFSFLGRTVRYNFAESVTLFPNTSSQASKLNDLKVINEEVDVDAKLSNVPVACVSRLRSRYRLTTVLTNLGLKNNGLQYSW